MRYKALYGDKWEYFPAKDNADAVQKAQTELQEKVGKDLPLKKVHKVRLATAKLEMEGEEIFSQ